MLAMSLWEKGAYDSELSLAVTIQPGIRSPTRQSAAYKQHITPTQVTSAFVGHVNPRHPSIRNPRPGLRARRTREIRQAESLGPQHTNAIPQSMDELETELGQSLRSD